MEGFSFSICADQSRGCKDPGSYRPSRRDSITVCDFAQSSCIFDRSIACTAHVCYLVARSRDGSSNGAALDTGGLEAGKMFKGCQYIGECYGSIVVYEDSDVTFGCKCKQVCLMNIEPVSSIPTLRQFR